MNGLTIGKAAAAAGVKISTIRFYERRGLLQRPSKTETYRRYAPDAIKQIGFIQRAQDLGFSLREIKDLLALRADPGTQCHNVYERAQGKISEIRDKIRSLQAMERALAQLAQSCRGNGPAGACSILEAMDPDCCRRIPAPGVGVRDPKRKERPHA